jgi:hypothetical protein
MAVPLSSINAERRRPDLEKQLQAKLDLARGKRRGNGAESRSAGYLVGRTKIGVIRDIEELAAELQFVNE